MSETLVLPAEQTTLPPQEVLDPRRMEDAQLLGEPAVTDTVIAPPPQEAMADTETLRPMQGLEIKIADEQVRHEVSGQVTGFRNFLRGDTMPSDRAEEENPARDTVDALGRLSDLSTLHINENDLTGLQAALEREGKSAEEVDTVIKGTLERMSRAIHHSIRGEDLFSHDIYKSQPGLLLSILKSGALKNKRGVTEMYGGSLGMTTGDHSQMLHMRQGHNEGLFYFAPGPLLDAAPYVSPGVDDYKHSGGAGVTQGRGNRIRGMDEAHGYGFSQDKKYAFTEVEIEISDELLAALPHVESPESRGDISFMASTESPAAAAAYEFSLTDAVIVLPDYGDGVNLGLEVEPDEPEAKLLHELGKNVSGYKRTLIGLFRSSDEKGSPDFSALNIPAENEAVWQRLLDETDKIQALYNEFQKATGKEQMQRGAMSTALLREQARAAGVSDEIIQNIFALEGAVPMPGQSLRHEFAQFIHNKKDPSRKNKMYVDYKSDKLQFSQADLANYCQGR